MNPDALVSAVAGQLRARTTSTPSTDWRAPMPADPCPTCDEARARADALQARLDAFAGPVEGVDVEARAEDSAELRAELVQVAAVALRWAAQLSGEDAGAALRGRTFGGER